MATILGIESTAHTFGIGVVRNGKILANARQSYVTKKGGIIPMDAAKFHQQNKQRVYFEALNESGINERSIDAVAFSQGPGLAPCLLIGLGFAKELAIRLKKPIVPVNHCIAHLEIGRLTGTEDPVMLYVSGANTQIIAYADGKYRIFGETLDIGVGNFIDNFARYAGIGFPGGLAMQNLAEKSRNYIELPYKVKGMDIALSGILTNLKRKIESKKYSLPDLAYSMQETVFAMLIESAERALAHTGKKELLLGGGVACNSRLQEMCKIMCRERIIDSPAVSPRRDQIKESETGFFCPSNELLTDNGAMIAFLGEIMFGSGIKFKGEDIKKVDIKPRERTDDIDIKWR